MAGLDEEAAEHARQHDPGSDLRVDERLARLIGSSPRHAGPDHEYGDWPSDLETIRPRSYKPVETTTGMFRQAWQQRFGGRDFGRSHLIVIVAIVVLGLVVAGWSVLRARPVALASGSLSGGATSAGPVSASHAPATNAPSGPASASPVATPDAATNSAPSTIKIHVMGAVKHPGVADLPEGSRVDDAIDDAGGLKQTADLGDLNLAQPLTDGQQIFVARSGGHSEVRDPVSISAAGSAGGSSDSGPLGDGSTGSSAGGGGGTTTSAPQTINLNTATPDQLDQLPGVGPVTAQKIILWRDQHGRFTAVEELQEVEGIGPKTYADLAQFVTV